MRRFILSVGLILAMCVLVSAKPLPAPKPPDFKGLTDESIKKWSGAELLVIGKFTQVTAGPVGLSNPPVRTYKLQISPEKILRGTAPVKQAIAAAYTIRQEKPPSFPNAETEAVIALKFVQNAWVVQSYEQAQGELADQAKLATSFPLGWTIKDNKLISPWASVGKPGKAEGSACSVTGRPVLLLGDGIRFSVAPVPAAVKMKFGNPDGDGEFQMIVKNETEQEREVPALLTDGKEIKWNECVVIRCQDKNYPIPGSTGKVVGLKSVVLKPGESVSGTVHALALQGPMWPKGGYRIEFQFCIGERSATHSFYYLSKHHDAVREALHKMIEL
jgi:hypothetical protein